MKKLLEVLPLLNLQLFAAPGPTQTTLLDSPGNDLSPEMKIYYQDRLIDMADPYLVHDQFGDKYPIPKGGGKTTEFRKFSPLDKALTALTEGVTPNGNTLDVTTILATVEQFGDYIEVSDMLELTAIDRVLEQSTKLLGSQAGRTLDTITREIITAGTNVMFAPKSDGTENLLRTDLDATSLLTVDTIFKAVAKLNSMNARPIDDMFVGVVHPNVACDLMLSDKWWDAHKYTNSENIYKGEIGRIGKVRFVETTEAKIIANSADGGLSTYVTMIIGANAYGTTDIAGGGLQHFVKQLGSGGTTDPLNQRATTGWKATKTAARLVEEYMVRIEHTSAADPNAASN